MSFCKERQKIVKKRVREKEKGNKGRVSAPSRCVYVCVCVCVREREREGLGVSPEGEIKK